LIDRSIGFAPTKASYDPRFVLKGNFYDDIWEPGFFDDGSFCEIKEDYGRSVLTGRARLGGIPVGVIAAETRSFKHKIRSDPAIENLDEVTVQRNGKILYSDSASKIAQAISDFSREELPLFIFANWWGFSGNIKDTNEQILKFQRDIVEELRKYSKPILIYLFPHAELRGTAWMTFDSQINPNYIEVYADPEAKASVIDPESMIDMKFKKPELKKLIHRLDLTINEVY
jgi:acetyl-CoA carboxylase/biotin carboxylase 1